MTRTMLMAVVLFALAWLPVAAQDSDRLSIRMVTAGQGEPVEDPQLKDVLPLLRNTLRFSSFTLVRKSTIRLADDAAASLPKGYDLSLSQVDRQDNTVTVTVTQGKRKKKLLETRLRLRLDRPVIVGGFDDPEGTKTIIILKLE